MTPSQPRIGQINTKLICDFLIQNSYERQSDAPPHVRASPCAAAAWIDLKLCTAAICDFRHQIRAFARQEKDGKIVFGPLGNFYFFFLFLTFRPLFTSQFLRIRTKFPRGLKTVFPSSSRGVNARIWCLKSQMAAVQSFRSIRAAAAHGEAQTWGGASDWRSYEFWIKNRKLIWR